MIHSLLKKYFGYSSFRPMQEEIINTILHQKDVLVLMPTGGGKSICYQIPALAMEGTALVISPLIALMKDQVEGLKANGIAAAYINSSLNPIEEIEVKEQCLEGKIKLLYLSPEKALAEINGLLRNINLSMIAIDEAHCISQWGHDFRPEYTQLKNLRKVFSSVPVVALTATADKVTRKDILSQLQIEESKTFLSSFDRPNLSLKVRSGVKEKDKVNEIVDFVKARPGQSGIVYCLSRKSTEIMSEKLNHAGVPTMHYHAGMDSNERSRVQENFIKDDVPVICATIAFGMGIDKSNVRWVIHSNMPKNMEGYYQEIGRAGRDGVASDTVLYYNLKDLVMLTKFARESGQSKINIEKLKSMQHFSEARICRRKILLSYFGESYLKNCGNCDVCKNPPKYFDGTVIAQKALSALSRLDEKAGTTMLIYILRGSHNAEVISKGYDKIKTYGVGKDLSFDAWSNYILQMIQLGVFEIAYDEGYSLKITDYGRSVLSGKAKVDLVNADLKPEKEIQKTYAKISDNNNTSLFETLRLLRKQIADAENLPPYIVFHDKSLKEMAEKMPQTKTQFLAINGVSETKYLKYGETFINCIIQNMQNENVNGAESINDALSDEKIEEYIKRFSDNHIKVSVTTIGKTLLGVERDFTNEKVKDFPFFGLLRYKTTYKDITPILKKYFSEKGLPKVIMDNKAADAFFTLPPFNTLSTSSEKSLRDAVNNIPLMRPNEEITNDYILEQRKTYHRAYEPWDHEEISLFEKALEFTNDLDLLSKIFQRNPNSLKAVFNKLKAEV